jgi:glycosyltransferase involved in cell wall biosynthesis
MSREPLGAARGLWRAMAPRSLRRAAQPLSLSLARSAVRRALAHAETGEAPGALVVSGLISEAKGVSQAARLTAAGLSAAGYSVTSHDLRSLLDARSGAGAILPGHGGVWLIHANPPEALKALARLPAAQWRNRYRIGYWAYELPRVPPLWTAASMAFHEVWAPSEFVADALRASGVAAPVRVMPHPVSTGAGLARHDRTRFHIPSRAFAVLAMGDLLSSATRKNLIGAIEIYRRAFPAPSDQTVLIIKTQPGTTDKAFVRQSRAAIDGRPDVLLLTDTLSQSDTRQLIASCDVVLSPHRAEGFGLALAEAFLLGVPALATGWSGNLDFMRDVPELLIDNRMVPVRDPDGVYRGARLEWAEPNPADAAAKLRALAGDSALRRSLAGRGKMAVERLSAAWNRHALDATAIGRLVER